METWKVEGFLRATAAILCVLTACLVGFDRQTKLLFHIFNKTATFKDLNALYVVVWIDSVAAAYNVMHLVRSYYMFPAGFDTGMLSGSYRLLLAWGIYLFDQGAAYVVFAGNTAALQGSMLAVTGEESFQWMKLCDKFTKFCFQIGGGLLCGYVASTLLAITSCLSAYSLFRFYSPKHFLLLKHN